MRSPVDLGKKYSSQREQKVQRPWGRRQSAGQCGWSRGHEQQGTGSGGPTMQGLSEG